MNNSTEIAFKSLLGKLKDQSASFSQKISMDGNLIAFSSIIGPNRESNQDRVVFAKIENQTSMGSTFYIGALSDGMGGMKEGGFAASITIAAFLSYVATAKMGSGLKEFIKNATFFTNEKVKGFLKGDGGATLAGVVYGRNGAIGVHVGDSRIYFYSGGKLEQLTVDDTISAQIANKNGKVDEWFDLLEADNRLAQHIGIEEGLEPHIIDLSEKLAMAKNGSGFILTSDGIHYIGNIMIERIIQNSSSNWEIGNRITSIAEWLSGHDNMSILMLPPSNFSTFNRNVSRETTIQSFLSDKAYEIYIPAAEHYQNQIPLDKQTDKQLKFDDSPNKMAELSKDKKNSQNSKITKPKPVKKKDHFNKNKQKTKAVAMRKGKKLDGKKNDDRESAVKIDFISITPQNSSDYGSKE